MSYITNIVEQAKRNEFFRLVLFTGARSQMVVMSIPIDGDIGEETHLDTEQTIVVVSGNAKVTLDGIESNIGLGDMVVVTPGVTHNLVNSGDRPLRVYTVYAPPYHIDGRLHKTKAEADADTSDQVFSNIEG